MKIFYEKSELDIPYHTPDQKQFYFRRCAEFDKAQIGYDKIVFLGIALRKVEEIGIIILVLKILLTEVSLEILHLVF